MGSSEKNRVIVQTALAGKSLRETAEQYGVSKVLMPLKIIALMNSYKKR